MNTISKVFFLIGDLRGGGAERAVTELLKTINPGKFSLTLVLRKKEGPYLNELPAHIQVIVLPKPPGVLNIFKRTFALAKFLNNEQPDVVVGNLTETNIYLLQSKPFLNHNIRIIITEQNNLSRNLTTLYTPLRRFYKKLQIKFTYKLADKVIAVSKGVKSDLVTNFGLSDEKVTVIENPVNIAQIQDRATQHIPLPCGFNGEKKLIVSVGRLAPQKGYFDMLEVFKLVNQQVPSQLIILGEGALRDQLEAQIKHLSLERAVCLPGFIDNPWALIHKADLYLSTSHWEGFSLSYIEAMATGTPLVVTDCDYGPRELIESGKNGVMVPVGQIDKIAEEVVALLSDKKRQKQMVMGGNEIVINFDSKVIAHKYELLFKKLIANTLSKM